MRTSVPNIFACGDVAGPYQFTHMASHQAWYAAVNALFGRIRKFKVNYAVVPWATYTDPEVARVGLSEDEAKARGIDVEVTRHELAHVDRAIADGETRGFIKVLTRRGSDRVLGATIVAPAAGELIAEYVLAHDARTRAEEVDGHDPHLSDERRDQQIRSRTAWRRNHAPGGAVAIRASITTACGVDATLNIRARWCSAAKPCSTVRTVCRNGFGSSSIRATTKRAVKRAEQFARATARALLRNAGFGEGGRQLAQPRVGLLLDLVLRT